jgi:hypothetical protein
VLSLRDGWDALLARKTPDPFLTYGRMPVRGTLLRETALLILAVHQDYLFHV